MTNAKRDVDAVRRSNPLSATVERLTGQQILRHKIRAPWREDGTPSLHIYEDGRWHDFGTGEHGDVIDFVGRYYFGAGYNPDVHFKDVVDKLGGLEITPLPAAPHQAQPETPKPKPQLNIDMAQIRHWHETMPTDRREWWYGRGLMDPIIDQFMLGWDGKRYTIPLLYRGVPFGVKRRQSELVDNFPDAKYMSVTGSRKGIFNADVLMTEKTVVICEGEIDAMLLNQYGFPAVSSTVGAGTWVPEWATLFGNVRRIKILYDNDMAGREGRKKVWATLRRADFATLPDGIKDVGDLVAKHDFPLTWLENNLR